MLTTGLYASEKLGRSALADQGVQFVEGPISVQVPYADIDNVGRGRVIGLNDFVRVVQLTRGGDHCKRSPPRRCLVTNAAGTWAVVSKGLSIGWTAQRIGQGLVAADLRHRHLIGLVYNRKEGSLAGDKPHRWNQLGRIQRRVIDDVVDDMEGWRILCQAA